MLLPVLGLEPRYLGRHFSGSVLVNLQNSTRKVVPFGTLSERDPLVVKNQAERGSIIFVVHRPRGTSPRVSIAGTAIGMEAHGLRIPPASSSLL